MVRLFYPYAGNITVAGLTTSEIKALLVDRLSSVIKKPQIDVRVASFNSQRVYVSGSVQQPGIVSISSVTINSYRCH